MRRRRHLWYSLFLVPWFVPSTTDAQVADHLLCGTRPIKEGKYQPHGSVKYGDRDTSAYIIPMVFHILHQGGPENISDIQVLDGVQVLNDAFNMQAGDTLGIFPGDTLVTADMEVVFCLATIDPLGMPTTGIVWYETPLTWTGMDPAAKLDPWPRDRYMNIWVVAHADTVTGYTLLPEVADTLPLQDGVVILHSCLGRIGTGSEFTARALPHEAGHFLGLLHPWDIPTGFGDCGDDLVDDTPITIPDIMCGSTVNCAPPTVEYLPNYMNVSYCQEMFTEGQKARAHGTLNSPVAQRDQLWQASNVLQVGACGMVAVDEKQKIPELRVYPDPFNEVVVVEGCTPGPVSVVALSMDGRPGWAMNVRSGGGPLQLAPGAAVLPGAHVLRIADARGTRSVLLLRE